MKAIKKEYQNTVIFNGKIGKDINTSEIEPNTYEFYIKNGLSFIFEDICFKCKNAETACTCSDFDKAKEEVKDYKKKK